MHGDSMNAKQCCKVGAYGTVISGLCCLRLLGVLLAVFGTTAAITYMNDFGDYVFIPSYIGFAALLVYGMLSLRKDWLTYSISFIVVSFGLYVTLYSIIRRSQQP